jgi:hypothetical protein
MSTLLIGFQDASPPRHVLAKLETLHERLEWVELEAIDPQVHSVGGLCPLHDGYAVLLQALRGVATVCYLAELDSTLRLRRSTELALVRAGICPVIHNGALLLIDPAANRVIRITWPAQAATPTEEVIFEAHTQCSQSRLNAIESFQGRLYLSLSGVQKSHVDPASTETAPTLEAANGTVLEFESAAVVAHLAHAGEFIVVADTLYCLDPDAHTLIPVAGRLQVSTVIATRDQLRGLAHHDGYIYLGAKTTLHPSDHTAPIAHDASCALYQHGCNENLTRRIDMSGFATAIGALLVLPDRLAPVANGADPLLQRLRALNAYTPELLRRHTHADHYHSECEALVRQLIDEQRAYVSAARLLRRLLQHATEPRPGWHFDYATCLMHVGSAQEALWQFQLALAHGYPAEPLLLPLARARAAAEARTRLPLELTGGMAPIPVPRPYPGCDKAYKAFENDAPGFDSPWLQAERTVEFDMVVLELMALLHSPHSARQHGA